jgi:nucleolar protein 56
VLVLRTTWFGVFLTEGEAVRDSILFPKDAREVARRLRLLQDGEVLSEEKQLAQRAPPFAVTERRQLKLGALSAPDESPVDLATRAGEYGFDTGLRREAFLHLARASVASARGRDVSAVQAVRTYEELLETSNRLSERLREWYGIHFPELARLVPTERYAPLVASGKTRDEILKEIGAEGIESSGSPLEEADLRGVRRIADTLVRLNQDQAALARALELAMDEVAPNLSVLLGPLLSARLLREARSLGRLARLPASTVQLLGAERALFRHLREGRAPPKHGVLFLHPAVHTAPPWARGKIARALATKAALAARADAFGKRRDLGADLKATFERRVEQVLRQGPSKKAKPPQRGPGPALGGGEHRGPPPRRDEPQRRR